MIKNPNRKVGKNGKAEGNFLPIFPTFLFTIRPVATAAAARDPHRLFRSFGLLVFPRCSAP
jgi:hypothetical protein